MALLQKSPNAFFLKTRSVLKTLNADIIAIQFKKVENPSDLVERLKDIYGKKLP